MKTSIFKKFFIFSIIIFILAAAFALYQFLAGGNTVSNNNIDIVVLGNAFTAGGTELPLQIEITNKNNLALETADLIVEYPKSSGGDLSSSIDTVRTRNSLGVIPAGGIRDENIKLVLYGEQGSIKPIKISLEYRIQDSNSIFVKEKPYEVTISSVPINLLVDAPISISPNQEFTLNVKVSSNATDPVSKMLLKIDYPIGFQFKSATPAPVTNNNVWNLGDLAPGSEHSIYIVGKMVDVFDGEQKVFHIWSGLQSDDDNSQIGVIYNSLGYTVAIKKAFIEANLSLNGISQTEYAFDSKTKIAGQIEWKNNLETEVNNVQVMVKISGNAFDSKSVIVDQGFYNSKTNSVLWDKSFLSTLARIGPGESGILNFSFLSLPIFSGATEMLLDPSINIDVSISGEQPQEGNLTTDLENSESKIVRFTSSAGLAAKAAYYSGPFTNKGPIPPKAEQETTYTIDWSLSNTISNISNAEVRATLPPSVRFIGPISPADESLTYNDATKEVVWNVGSIPRGTGITEANREVFFQVGFTPTFSQINTQPIIINDAVLTGHDDFANVDIKVNRTSLNTGLYGDSSFPSNGGRVVE